LEIKELVSEEDLLEE